MYRRIVVAIDGSPNAEHALRHAVDLARGLSAALCIVHVVDTGWLGLGMELSFDTEPLACARRAAGARLLEDARRTAQTAGLAAETRLEELSSPADSVAAAIARAAAAWPADLVVLGTHGRRGVERMLLGSVAEGAARLSPAPVLLVTPPAVAAS